MAADLPKVSILSNYFARNFIAKQPQTKGLEFKGLNIRDLKIRDLKFKALGLALLLATLLLKGCANHPKAIELPVSQTPQEPIIPSEPFKTETLYSLMVAELAGSRDRLDIMLSNYVKQAIDTQDAGITERAAHLANFVRDAEATLQMANQWAALAPNNEQARYMAMAALADDGRYFEAFEHGRYLLSQSPSPAAQADNQALKSLALESHSAHGLDALAVKVTSSNASEQTLASLLKLYTPLRTQYPSDAELTLAISFLEYALKLLPEALISTQKAQALRPDYEQAYIQELRILGQQDSTKAQVRLSEIVDRFPNNQRLRLQYARNLTLSDLPAAALQFEQLLEQSPGDGNIQLALALTRYQLTQFDAAKTHFLALAGSLDSTKLSAQSPTSAQVATARYYLGKIAEQQGKPLEAIEHYIRVSPSKEFLPALAQGLSLMHQHNQQEQALQVLIAHQLIADNQYQEGISLLLAEHYQSTGNPQAAKRALDEGIAQFPQSEGLLLSRAMHFVTLGNMAAAEQDLQTLITVNPKNSDALNTLGYILVDANTRVLEGKGYIERSLSLDPNNPAAIDSLGWAYYRLGDYEKATALLKKALNLMPNDEIAAHLGEVLWMSGQQDAAIDVWKQGLALNPNSTYIHQRLKQFNLLGES